MIFNSRIQKPIATALAVVFLFYGPAGGAVTMMAVDHAAKAGTLGVLEGALATIKGGVVLLELTEEAAVILVRWPEKVEALARFADGVGAGRVVLKAEGGAAEEVLRSLDGLSPPTSPWCPPSGRCGRGRKPECRPVLDQMINTYKHIN